MLPFGKVTFIHILSIVHVTKMVSIYNSANLFLQGKYFVIKFTCGLYFFFYIITIILLQKKCLFRGLRILMIR